MKKFIWIMAIVFGFALLGCGLGSPKTNDASPVIYDNGTPRALETSKPASFLTQKDFTASVKIKSNDCFDEYGCNRSYSVKISTDLEKLAADGHSYEVSYEVKGGAEGTKLGTVTVAPDGGYMQFDDFTRVSSNSNKLTAKITVVERLAY